MHLDRDFVNMLNILSLLRERPMSYDELWKSGCFKKERNLEISLTKLHNAGCIEIIQSANIYCMLGYGYSLLAFFPTWRPLPVAVLDVIVGE